MRPRPLLAAGVLVAVAALVAPLGAANPAIAYSADQVTSEMSILHGANVAPVETGYQHVRHRPACRWQIQSLDAVEPGAGPGDRAAATDLMWFCSTYFTAGSAASRRAARSLIVPASPCSTLRYRCSTLAPTLAARESISASTPGRWAPHP